MFERSIESLIKGFRSHRGKDEAKYLASVLAEIRHEVRGGDMEIKAEGILKLVYVSAIHLQGASQGDPRQLSQAANAWSRFVPGGIPRCRSDGFV